MLVFSKDRRWMGYVALSSFLSSEIIEKKMKAKEQQPMSCFYGIKVKCSNKGAESAERDHVLVARSVGLRGCTQTVGRMFLRGGWNQGDAQSGEGSNRNLVHCLSMLVGG